MEPIDVHGYADGRSPHDKEHGIGDKRPIIFIMGDTGDFGDTQQIRFATADARAIAAAIIAAAEAVENGGDFVAQCPCTYEGESE